MSDKLSQVGKTLGQTKRNSEAALRRYSPQHPRVERTRDIFDDVIPFEMEFETGHPDELINMSLYFNKPPPLKSCKTGRYSMICEEFTLGSGDHLVQLSSRYKSGTISVFLNGIQTLNYSEYDSTNGLIYVSGSGEPTQVFNICYILDTWVTCPPDFTASNFTSNIFQKSVDDDADIAIDLSNGSATMTANSTIVSDPSGFATVTLAADTTGVSFPSDSNFRITWECSLAGPSRDETDASVLGGAGPFSFLLRNYLRTFADDQVGFYISYPGSAGFQKISSSTFGIVTIDYNVERGTAILLAGGMSKEAPISGPSTYSTAVSFTFTVRQGDSEGASTSAHFTGLQLGCSLEAASG